MKVTIRPLEGHREVVDGWAKGIPYVRAEGIVWRFQIGAEEIPSECTELFAYLEQADYLGGVVRRKRPVLVKRLGFESMDTLISEAAGIRIYAWGYTRLTLTLKDGEDSEAAALHTESILLVSRINLMIGALACLISSIAVLWWRWDILRRALALPEQSVPEKLTQMLTVIGSLLFGGVSITVLDKLIEWVRESSPGRDGALKLWERYSVIPALAVLLVAMLVPPLAITEIENKTKAGNPRLEGYSVSLGAESKEKTAYVFRFFSDIRLEKEDEEIFKLSEDSSERSFWSKLDPPRMIVDCNKRAWEAEDAKASFELMLDSGDCSVNEEQEFDLNEKALADASLKAKPFGGVARWTWKNDLSSGTVQCKAPKEANLSLIVLETEVANDSGAEFRIECRRDGEKYEHVSESMVKGRGSKVGIPVCIPDDCIDIRASYTGDIGKPLDLQKLGENRKVAMSNASCPWDKEPPSTRAGFIKLEQGDPKKIGLRAGGCETVEDIVSLGKFAVLVRGEQEAAFELSDMAMGDRLGFTQGLFGNASVKISWNDQSWKVKCPSGADTLMILGTDALQGLHSEVIWDGAPDDDKASANWAFGEWKMRRGKKTISEKVIWLCLPSDIFADHTKDEQCDKRKRILAADGRRLWVDTTKGTLEYCEPSKPQCCFVCPQYWGDPKSSPIIEFADCKAGKAGLVQRPLDECRGLKKTENGRCP